MPDRPRGRSANKPSPRAREWVSRRFGPCSTSSSDQARVMGKDRKSACHGSMSCNTRSWNCSIGMGMQWITPGERLSRTSELAWFVPNRSKRAPRPHPPIGSNPFRNPHGKKCPGSDCQEDSPAHCAAPKPGAYSAGHRAAKSWGDRATELAFSRRRRPGRLRRAASSSG